MGASTGVGHGRGHLGPAHCPRWGELARPLLTAGAAALVLVALPWVAGQAARSRRLYLEQVERRLVEAERDRDARAQRAALDERRHIARELHDVVAHHVSLIGVQAGAARVALGAGPDSTREALLAIERSSRSAVGEMRHLLDVLRADGGAAELESQPGLGRLDELIANFGDAGLQVTLRADGPLRGLSPLVDLCCYRIVEEALTNVTRHSTAAVATVDIRVEQEPRRVLPAESLSVCTIRASSAGPPGQFSSFDGRSGPHRHARASRPLRRRTSATAAPQGGFSVRAKICEPGQL